MRVKLLGIPLDLGAKNLGVDTAPLAFRKNKIITKLKTAGFVVKDAGDVKCKGRKDLKINNPKLKYLEEIVRVSEEAADKTASFLQNGEKAVVLGGDHSSCLGPISGAAAAFKEDLGLIYLDAHGDMNTNFTTKTGNIHGMPLAALMGLGDAQLTNIYKKKIKIKKENMLHIGGNDFDPGEIELIEKEKLNCFTMTDMLAAGLKPLFENISNLSKKVKKVWVSLDLDVIDEMYAPGVGMPNKAGFSYREIVAIAGFIGKNCEVIGVDIAEYNPTKDIKEKTAELGIELLAKLLGKNYSWYTNYLRENKL